MRGLKRHKQLVADANNGIKEYYNKNKHLGIVIYEKGSIDSDHGEYSSNNVILI